MLTTTFVCSDVLAQCVVWVSADTVNRNNMIDCSVMLGHVEKFLRRLVQDSQPSIVFGYRPNPVSGQLASCAGVSVHTTYHDGYSVPSLTNGINAIINGLTLLQELSQLRARA